MSSNDSLPPPDPLLPPYQPQPPRKRRLHTQGGYICQHPRPSEAWAVALSIHREHIGDTYHPSSYDTDLQHAIEDSARLEATIADLDLQAIEARRQLADYRALALHFQDEPQTLHIFTLAQRLCSTNARHEARRRRMQGCTSCCSNCCTNPRNHTTPNCAHSDDDDDEIELREQLQRVRAQVQRDAAAPHQD
jgi:hypothetical protein